MNGSIKTFKKDNVTFTELYPKFRTKAGKLTRYAFACGYIEQKEIDDNNRGSIEMNNGTFEVKGFRNGAHFYQVFRLVKDARKYLNDRMKPDKRYTIAKEFCGYKDAKHVLRFCDTWINCFDTLEEAKEALVHHNKNR